MNLRSLLSLLSVARNTTDLARRVLPKRKQRQTRRKASASLARPALLMGILGVAAYLGWNGLEWGTADPANGSDTNLGASVATGIDPASAGHHSGSGMVQVGASQAQAGGTLIIGSFNIQTFGRAKLSNPSVMRVLVDVARRFDLLAIQELRSTEQDIVPQFVEQINADGSNFRYIVGPRQGYTVSKEQYVYLYDANKLAPLAAPYLAADTSGRFHRTPLVCHFRTLQLPPHQSFSFVLMNVHTDPDEIRFEIPQLQTIIEGVRAQHPQEDDLIVLGDFNAPPRYFLTFGWFRMPWAAIDDAWVTNVRETENFDNLVFDQQATSEFTGRRGVFNFRGAYQLTPEDALQVSDHFPVWAEFSIEESRSRIAEVPVDSPAGNR